MIKCFIIRIPEMDRSKDLLRDLNPLIKSGLIRVNFIDGILVDKLKLKNNELETVDINSFFKVYGRSITTGEAGCALAHNFAREIISKLKTSCIVLEDDVRIPDIDAFSNIIYKFLDLSRQKEHAVLNFAFGLYDSNFPISQNRILRMLGPTSLAAGYMLTPSAANKLLRANKPIKYVADWPRVWFQSYVSLYPTIKHETSYSSSIINQINSKKYENRNTKMQINIKNIQSFNFFSAFIFSVGERINRLLVAIYRLQHKLINF